MAHNCKSPWQPNGLQLACHFCYLYCNYKPKKFNIVQLTRMITTNPINKKTSTTELIIDSQWIWKSSDYNKLIKNISLILHTSLCISFQSQAWKLRSVVYVEPAKNHFVIWHNQWLYMSRSLFVIRLWQR